MGYTTDFTGQFLLDRALTEDQRRYLAKFNDTRRMKRNSAKAGQVHDPLRLAVGLPIGQDGGYHVGGEHHLYIGDDIIDHNVPAPGQLVCNLLAGNMREIYDANQALILTGGCQPGLWCQWTPNADGTAIVWDQAEKFYHYIPWIKYLIAHFLAPWGLMLNGSVQWEGENPNDKGTITITDNEVKWEKMEPTPDETE